MPARRIAGFVVAVAGILAGLFLSVPSLVLALGYWNAPETGGNAGRAVLVVAALLGFGVGYGLYRLGRWIAKA